MPANKALGAAFVLLLVAPAMGKDEAPQEEKGPPVSEPGAGLSAPLWTPQAAPAQRQLEFKALPRFFNKAKIQLSGGAAALDLEDWRAVAISNNADKERCTLTLIGPRVVLLAAHCVDAGLAPGAAGIPTIGANVQFKTATYGMDCTMSDLYRAAPVNSMGAPRSTEDYALCELSGPVSEVRPETIDIAIKLAAGGKILLMGYGCTRLGISEDGRYTYVKGDKTLNMGQQDVEAIDRSIYPGKAGVYVRTRSDKPTQPVICYGDSGGPAMTSATSGPGRRVVAVNSAFGATDMATADVPSFYSYVSPLSSKAFSDFLKDWVDQPKVVAANRKDRRVCGYSIIAGLSGCRP